MVVPNLKSLVVGFLVLAIFFSILERIFPAVRGRPVFRRGFRTDLFYWFFTPVVTKSIGHVCAVIALVLAALLFGAPLKGEAIGPWIENRRTFVAALPTGLQVLLALFVSDFCSYWLHRFFHRGRAWRFHAVHHSAIDLDWLSSVRVHPVNEFVSHAIHVVVLFAFGFKPLVFAGLVPFFGFYGVFLHANLPFSFGPLKYIIATPNFHRWHHTSQSEGLDKNFAGLFPFIDILFGTFHMPKNKIPQRFGITENDMPEGFWGQCLYPFRKSARERLY